MPQRETLNQQHVKLYEIRNLIAHEIGSEADRAIRDALFAAGQSVELVLWHLREVAYRRENFTQQEDE